MFNHVYHVNPTFNWVLLREIMLQLQQKPQAVSKDLKGIVMSYFNKIALAVLQQNISYISFQSLEEIIKPKERWDDYKDATTFFKI